MVCDSARTHVRKSPTAFSTFSALITDAEASPTPCGRAAPVETNRYRRLQSDNVNL